MWLGLVFIVVLLAFGLAMVALVAAAVIAGLLTVASLLIPWLLIVAGVWLVARALRGPDRRDQRRPAPSPRVHHPGSTHRQQQRQHAPPPMPSGAAARPAAGLPIDVQVKVDQIRRKADMLLGYADRFSPFSHDLYIVRQTAADYLPRTIDAYLAVPGIGHPTLGPGAARALDELKSQLQLLDVKLDEIAVDLQRSDLNRLLANRRFLEERFGARDRGSELTVLRQGSGAA
jgi:hypothetical protein